MSYLPVVIKGCVGGGSGGELSDLKTERIKADGTPAGTATTTRDYAIVTCTKYNYNNTVSATCDGGTLIFSKTDGGTTTGQMYLWVDVPEGSNINIVSNSDTLIGYFYD